MAEILVFGGTTEGRRFSEWLSKRKTEHILSVATDYGKEVLTENKYMHVQCGRMDTSEIEHFIAENKIKAVVDATHPFASEATANIKAASDFCGVMYLRLDRNKSFEEKSISEDQDDNSYFKDTAECANALRKTTGNILLTTGSKELSAFCIDELRDRLYVRVLPAGASLEICEKNNIAHSNIIAMQGPFSKELNMALIKEFDIRIMVTKASGRRGGFYEKEAAARELGIQLFVIGQPDNSKGMSFNEVCESLSDFIKERTIKISLIGKGMGSRNSMTIDAARALESSELVFGAKRLICDISDKEVYPYYLGRDIIPVIKERQTDVAVLFSGDTGFYSGTGKLYEALMQEIKSEEINAEIKIYPGISSIASLAAHFAVSWEDAVIFSTHGKGDVLKWGNKLISRIRTSKKVFTIFSGIDDVRMLGELMENDGLDYCEILLGYKMSYDDEEYLQIYPRDVKNLEKEGLYAAFIINNRHEEKILTCGLRDDELTRGKAPMTKEEVREVSISKLGLRENSIVYDIGSGTGSIAAEIARLDPYTDVYAIECNEDALYLIEQNKERYSLGNITVIKGMAPDAIKELPAPTHAFIGGSKGRLKEIISELLYKNPKVHIVINAISLETLRVLTEIDKEFDAEDFEIVSMQVSRSRRIGGYNMMQGENPIWICSFKGK